MIAALLYMLLAPPPLRIEGTITVRIEHAQPAPVPGPARQTASLSGGWLVVIEETQQASARRGAYFANRSLRERLQSYSLRVRIADQDARDARGQIPADLAPYLARVRGRSLPALLLVSAEGRILHEGALPATPAELVDLVARIGGVP